MLEVWFLQIFKAILTSIQRDVLREVRRAPGVSRGTAAQRLGVRPNSVGDAVARLLELRLVREGSSETSGAGRPQVPLFVDTTEAGRTVLGVAARGGRAEESPSVQVRSVNLLGRATGQAWNGPGGPDATAAVAQRLGPQTLGVSIALPGLLDEQAEPASLPGLLETLASMPGVLDNDNHALAARWTLTQSPEGAAEDTLIVQLADGRLGASLLIDGRPNRGVVRGGNELGHTRLPVATDRCFCGYVGCLERIASTAFLHRHGASRVRTLAEIASAYPSQEPGDDHAMHTLLDALALGVANALQLLRPHRLVVVSELTRFPGFRDAWFTRVRSQLFPELQTRIAFDVWDQPLATPAESAAHLGLAALFDGHW